VETDFFRSAVGVISRHGTCVVRELWKKESGDWTIVTFDDGLVSDFDIAYRILQEHGVKATFFVTVSKIGKTGYLLRTHLQDMAACGMEVGSHGMTHSYLTTMAPDRVRQEIVESKERLQQMLGVPVQSFAPVGGLYQSWMPKLARDTGYHSFATMIPGVTHRAASDFFLRRNHLQSHHDLSYLKSLLCRDRFLLKKNSLRYWILFAAKRLLGMQRYDRLKGKLVEIGA
jgi:peptidoglycan/xylan/chitin deacetylase (PgdA/CDA1 family)